jgi:hypothetical protein
MKKEHAIPELVYSADAAHRKKHRWDKAEPSHVPDDDGKLVGKCSSKIDEAVAQRLLEEGIPWNPKTWRKKHPKMVFNVFEGVPYRAHRMGNGYHGFPDIERNVPKSVRDDLRSRAAEQGFEKEFDDWMERTRTL